MDQLHLIEFIGVLAAFLLSGFVKGVLGFGLPLVGMSLLSSFIPVDMALALLVLPIVAINLWQGLQGGYFVEIVRRFWPLILGLGTGIGVGAAIAAGISDRQLFLLVGLTMLSYCAVGIWQPGLAIPPRSLSWVGPLAGFSGGILGGISTIYGPPLLIVLSSLKLPKDLFVAAAGVLLFSGSIFLTIAFGSVGILTVDLAVQSALSVVPVFAGVMLGQRLRNRIPQEGFRKVVLLGLFVIGVNLIRRAIF